MSATTATLSWRKTQRGEWVVYGPAAALVSGRTVTVTKRNGTGTAETIARVGKTFTVDGQTMVYGYPVPRAARTTSRSGGMCDECGDRPAATTARDMSGIPGRVCWQCKRDEGSLSFC